MSQLKLSGDASGTGIVTVAAPNTNNTYTVTLPASAGTFAQTDVAQTFTGTQTFSSNPVLNGGTANGVLYLNGSKVATSGSALTFNGTSLGVGISAASAYGVLAVSNGTNQLGTTFTSNAPTLIAVNNAGSAYVDFITDSSNQIFKISGTERARITSGGDLQIANGNLVISTSGKGIDFSATSSGSGTMTSELLSDYEEGTWTPVMDSNTAGSGRVSTGSGAYTKIGRMVHAYCDVTLSTLGTGGSGRWVIKGFPFTMGGTWSGTVGFFADLNANVNYISCFTNGGATQVFMTLTTAAAATIVDAPDFSTYVKANSRVMLAISYQV